MPVFAASRSLLFHYFSSIRFSPLSPDAEFCFIEFSRHFDAILSALLIFFRHYFRYAAAFFQLSTLLRLSFSRREKIMRYFHAAIDFHFIVFFAEEFSADTFFFRIWLSPFSLLPIDAGLPILSFSFNIFADISSFLRRGFLRWCHFHTLMPFSSLSLLLRRYAVFIAAGCHYCHFTPAAARGDAFAFIDTPRFHFRIFAFVSLSGIIFAAISDISFYDSSHLSIFRFWIRCR